jgi:hypothetical protein
MNPPFASLLGVRWRSKNYVFLSAPFGLSPACSYASLITAEIVSMALARGVTAAKSYIDDVTTSHATREGCNRNLRILLDLLAELCVPVAPEKVEEASQRQVFLGVLYDTVACTMEVEEGYQARVAADLTDMARTTDGYTELKAVETVVGRLFWVSQVDVRIRGWARSVRGAAVPVLRSGCRMVKLTRDLRKLLRCTAAALAPVLSTTVLAWKPPPGLPVLLRSDASGPDGFGCHVGEEARAGPGSMYPWWLSSTNMTQKELVPILHGMHKWGAQWTGKYVVAATDNEGACMAFNHGHSGNAQTHEWVVRLQDAAYHYGVFLVLVHCPREFNEAADYLTHVNRHFSGRIRRVGHGFVLEED